MQIAKVTRVYINPPQSNEFIVEIYWRYPGESTWKTANDNVTCNADGTLQSPLSILYDDAVNNSIQIRIVFQGCPTTVPFEYVHSGTTTTTSTNAPAQSRHLDVTNYAAGSSSGILGTCEIFGFTLNRTVEAANDSTASGHDVNVLFSITTDNGTTEHYTVLFTQGLTTSDSTTINNSAGGTCSMITELNITSIQIV